MNIRYRQPLLRDLDHLYAAAKPEIAVGRFAWNRRLLRRLLYGLPHQYRFGRSEERIRLMSIFLGVQFVLIAVGGAVGLLCLVLADDQGASLIPRPGAAWLYPLFGVSGVIFLFGPPSRWKKGAFNPTLRSPSTYHILVILVIAATALFCSSLNTFAIAGSPFFFPSSAYAFTFFTNWRALLYTLIASTAYGAVLAIHNVPGWSAALTFHVAVSLVVGSTLGIVVSREWSFRQSHLLSLATLSHKLRTPLAGMIARGHEALATTDDTVPSPLRDDVDKITVRAEFLLHLLEQLLDITRSEAGVGPLRLSSVNLRQLVENIRNEFSPRATSAGKQLSVAIPSDPCELEADEEKIYEAIENLLDNALKFTPEGGSVDLELITEDESYCIRVSDSGAGVAPADRERIFRPFEQGTRRPEGSPPGAGLGLPLARIYARQHRGDLTLGTPQEAIGATLELRLPHTRTRQQGDGPVGERPKMPRRLRLWPRPRRSNAPEDVAGAQNSSQPAPEADSRLITVRDRFVLVVDDMADDLEVAASVLGRQGFDVATAVTGEGALQALQSAAHLDLILLDIDLPDVLGPELLIQIRLLSGWRSAVPVVAYTAFAEPDAEKKFRDVGFDAYLPKPLSQNGLPFAVLSLMDRAGSA